MSLRLCRMRVALEDGPDRLLAGGVAGGDLQELVVRGFWHPSLWTRVLQCVLLRNALMTSASTTLGSELHYLEKRWM